MRPELPRQGGDLTQMPPTPIIPQQLGTVGTGRRVVLCPVSLSPHRSSHRKGTTDPPPSVADPKWGPPSLAPHSILRVPGERQGWRVAPC